MSLHSNSRCVCTTSMNAIARFRLHARTVSRIYDDDGDDDGDDDDDDDDDNDSTQMR